MDKWIGVDLDGTLAHYDKWRGADHIGKPVMPMVRRIKSWMKQGKTVKIFTARAAEPSHIPPVKRWLKDNGLPALEVTNVKDHGMVELWDDRVVRVVKNRGKRC